MSRRKSLKGLVVDVVLLVFWVAILVYMLLAEDLILAVVAFICVFVFSALLGRDIRRRRQQ